MKIRCGGWVWRTEHVRARFGSRKCALAEQHSRSPHIHQNTSGWLFHTEYTADAHDNASIGARNTRLLQERLSATAWSRDEVDTLRAEMG